MKLKYLTLFVPVIFVACTAGARQEAVVIAENAAICVAQNQDLPLTELVAKCASETVTPADIEKLLATQKAATAKAASKAAGCDKGQH